MKQESKTVDVPAAIAMKAENLAVVFGLTRVYKGEEQANVSIIYRILIEMGLSDRQKFIAFVDKTQSNEKYIGELKRSTFQATDETVMEIMTCAKEAGLLKRDEGGLVPNFTQTVVKLLEYAVSQPIALIGWFGLCVDEGLKDDNRPAGQG